MNAYWLVNGAATRQSELTVRADARFLRYGDGMFESMRMKGDTVISFQQHRKRLNEACAFLGIELPSQFNLAQEARQLWQMAGQPASARLRLQVCRAGGTFYRPEGHDTLRILELLPLDEHRYPGGPVIQSLGVFEGQPVNPAPLGNFKTSSCLPSILAANWAKTHGFDDVLLLDHKGHLAEATASNFFAVVDGVIITPNLKYGGLRGVMRQTVLALARTLGFTGKELGVRPSLLNEATEVFLTSAVRGVVPVIRYQDRALQTTVAETLLAGLNRQTFS